MAAADQQFLDALKYLGQSGQEYGIKRQMDQVNQRAEEIRSTMKDEVQRRQALRNLAQMSSISVAGSGGNAQQQAAIQNLLPPIPTGVQQAYLQGSLTGDQQMVDVAKQMQAEEERQKLALEERKAALTLRMAENKEDVALRRDAMKSGRQEYDKLGGLERSSSEMLAALDRAEKALNNSGAFADTGPIDQVFLGLSDKGQAIKTTFADIGTKLKLALIAQAGSVKVADTEPEAKRLDLLSPNTSLFPARNLEMIKNMRKEALSLQTKARRARYSLERSGFTSAQAYADEYASSAKRAPGVRAKEPKSGRHNFE